MKTLSENEGELDLVMETMEQGGIKPADVALYLVLMLYVNQKGEPRFPGQTTLAKLVGGVSVDTIRRSLRRLEHAGLIETARVLSDDGRIHNNYRLLARS